MRSYIIKRLLVLIPTLLILSLVIFFLVRLIPGDIISSMGATDPRAVIDRAMVERELGLDAPAMVQYGRWMGFAPQDDGSFSGIFQGNLGDSWRQRGFSVVHLVSKSWPVTVEHAAIAILPLFALCDRNDIGGLSTSLHPDTGKAQIFIYDAYPGGIGIAEKGFDLMRELWQATLKVIIECPCEEGCPSCIQSPKCGNNNEPLDKKAAQILLEGLIG